jgi:uncharacterized protein (DUF2147 family)
MASIPTSTSATESASASAAAAAAAVDSDKRRKKKNSGQYSKKTDKTPKRGNVPSTKEEKTSVKAAPPLTSSKTPLEAPPDDVEDDSVRNSPLSSLSSHRSFQCVLILD